MRIKYILISILIFILASCTPTPMYAQWIVSDPGSIGQRLTLFLEELSEAMQERYTLEQQVGNTYELLEQSKESLKKLQDISNFIRSALVVKEIAEEGNNVVKKVESINNKFSKLDLTKEEVCNVLNFTVEIGERIYDKVKESKKMSSSKDGAGEMTDYERLQILNNIKDEIVKTKKSLTSMENRFKSKNSYELFTKQAREYTREALFMAFENENETEGIKKSSNSSTKSSSKKSSKKSTKTSK